MTRIASIKEKAWTSTIRILQALRATK
jgi:hypothetical protein